MTGAPIGSDDLSAAVAAGIVTEAQAASLAALSRSRAGAREAIRAGDEPFELFKGFNEIFIVVGLVILATGWTAVTGLLVVDSGNLLGSVRTTGVVSAAIVWLLAEYFTRRRRMVAPSITLTIFWAASAFSAFFAGLGQVFMVAQQDYSSTVLPLALTTVAVLVYWVRFKVPFALALVALGAFATALVSAATRSGNPVSASDIFLLSGDGPFALITLAIGAIVFAVAMAFDMSDPHRVTRRSSNGFWLHLVAAPALVNTVALSLLEQDTFAANMVLLAILALFALVAIVIDRRSFLIAAVGYCVTLGVTLLGPDGAPLSVLALGVFLVALGAFWERFRARVLATLAPILPLDRLPPSTGGARE